MAVKYDFKALFLGEETCGKVIHLIVTDKLEKTDYDDIVPIVERQIEEFGPVRLFLELTDFDGWTASACWEECKLAYKHLGNDVERIAVVGDKAWEHGMSAFINPFTKTNVKYFDIADRSQAEQWIQEGL